MSASRPYRGPIQAVVLDWAGTTVDYGSQAPVAAMVEAFRRRGIELTAAQARAPMGAGKRDHLAAIARMPEVAEAWRARYGAAPSEADVDALYADFVPVQLECLAAHATLIPGTLEAVAAFRERGLKIATTTGYNREMMALLLERAREQGYEPDCTMTVDDVPAGRPAPWMCFRNAIALGAYPMETLVKVGDTVPDIEEGLNAGMWTIGLAMTGNELGLSEREAAVLAPGELEAHLARARETLRRAGAHEVVDGIGDVPALLDGIEARLAAGERP